MIAGDGGKRYDRFRDRIMFPIHDSRARSSASAAGCSAHGEPKYLNSPETPLFSKGRELYGLFLARTPIRDAGRVVVVEGYMDVVALAQHGIEYAVATLGTATTPIHAQKLFRLTDRVVFCFDGDNAGRKAAWRALENTLPVLADGKDARSCSCPTATTPTISCASAARPRSRRDRRATPLSEFLLRELAAQHPPHRRRAGRAGRRRAAALAALTAPVLAALLRRGLAELSGLPEAELRALLPAGPRPRARPRAATPRRAGRPRPAPASSRRAPSLVRELIQGLLLQPEPARTIAIPQPDDATPGRAAWQRWSPTAATRAR